MSKAAVTDPTVGWGRPRNAKAMRPAAFGVNLSMTYFYRAEGAAPRTSLDPLLKQENDE